MAANVATGETILKAIKNEIEARAFYLAVARKVKNPLVRRKFLGLADDELEHRQTLSRLYWAQTGSEVGDLQSPEMEVPAPDVKSMTLIDALKMAIEAEKEAVENYSRMAEEIDDPRSKRFLEYLAEFENGHYETLTQELERIKDREFSRMGGSGGFRIAVFRIFIVMEQPRATQPWVFFLESGGRQGGGEWAHGRPCEVINLDRVAKSPSGTFCSSESEKRGFRFPYKSMTYISGH